MLRANHHPMLKPMYKPAMSYVALSAALTAAMPTLIAFAQNPAAAEAVSKVAADPTNLSTWLPTLLDKGMTIAILLAYAVFSNKRIDAKDAELAALRTDQAALAKELASAITKAADADRDLAQALSRLGNNVPH